MLQSYDQKNAHRYVARDIILCMDAFLLIMIAIILYRRTGDQDAKSRFLSLVYNLWCYTIIMVKIELRSFRHQNNVYLYIINENIHTQKQTL